MLTANRPDERRTREGAVQNPLSSVQRDHMGREGRDGGGYGQTRSYCTTPRERNAASMVRCSAAAVFRAIGTASSSLPA